ncbi:hypothetical protein B9Z55_000184 [Caenorhabditis nigoni]|uniref:DUF38 domain-containing protein n=1 Tax=Caenorhabditis nigoni TaxID=1611254 RepID=A0A2G5VHP0_9PELO|nr:hypothetical protein B9Z55_000184 [Caenorhabditis nigoni]
MESKPMLFCDTKTVLAYMEPNFRFNLALKIPLIGPAEKAAPLIINRLELHDNRFVINDTGYRMTVYRQCQADAGLYNGEVDDDSDEYGFKINLDESLQPGDLKLTHSGNMHQRRKYTHEVLQYDCPEKMCSLPCNHFIRLYVSGSMYEFPYQKMKMYQMMKRLLTTFFGNRTGEWTVKNMILQNSVLRWPKNGRKPILQNVEIGEYTPPKLDALQSITDTSVPLTSLKMRVLTYQPKISNHKFWMNVEHLIISEDVKVLYHMFSIQTPNVSVTTPTPLDVNLKSLINKFMMRTRPIGIRISIRASSKMDLNMINHRSVLETSTDAMKLTMRNEAVVNVQYTEIDSKTWLTIETVPNKG